MKKFLIIKSAARKQTLGENGYDWIIHETAIRADAIITVETISVLSYPELLHPDNGKRLIDMSQISYIVGDTVYTTLAVETLSEIMHNINGGVE